MLIQIDFLKDIEHKKKLMRLETDIQVTNRYWN